MISCVCCRLTQKAIIGVNSNATVFDWDFLYQLYGSMTLQFSFFIGESVENRFGTFGVFDSFEFTEKVLSQFDLKTAN